MTLEADINTYLTSWKFPSDSVVGGKPINLRELLTHTAGTTVHGFPGYASTELVPTLVQVLNCNQVQLRHKISFGTGFGLILLLGRRQKLRRLHNAFRKPERENRAS